MNVVYVPTTLISATALELTDPSRIFIHFLNLFAMSSHDEYSSDEEDLFENKSDVYLGFTDVAFAEEDEEPTIEDTFIGGQPLWLHSDSRPLDKQLQCENCHKEMALLLQAFAPLDDKPYDRVIYIFGCKNSGQCSKQKGSIKAIRGVNKSPERVAEIEAEQAAETQKLLDEKLRLEDKKKLQIEMTKDLFDATKPSENPFGASNNPFGGSNPFTNPFGQTKEEPKEEKELEPKQVTKQKPEEKTLSYADVAKPKNKPSPASKTNIKLPEYPGYFVFTEQEKLKKVTLEPELEKYKHLIDKMDPEESSKERSMSTSSGSGLSNVLNLQTQKISNMLNDTFFENFSNVVNHNSSQVLRYDLGGKPLLYSGRDDVARTFSTNSLPDPAYNPSSHRQFELQLMPKTIIDLEEHKNKSIADILSGMSWGTIIVATDVEDFVPQLDENHVGYVQEYCGVQWEESV